MDNMLDELTPAQLVEWEAALTVLDLDVNRWAAGKICETLERAVERFASYDTKAEAIAAQGKLPTHEDFMELWEFGERKDSVPFTIQSQEEIANTLRGWKR